MSKTAYVQTFPFIAAPTLADTSRLVAAFRGRRETANSQIGRRLAKAARRLARAGHSPDEVARLYESARFLLVQLENA